MWPRGAAARDGRAHHPGGAAPVDELVATPDLNVFRAGLAELGAEERAALRARLATDAYGEPTERQRTVGVPLVERMRSPAAVLLRQIRLEKLRILDEAASASI